MGQDAIAAIWFFFEPRNYGWYGDTNVLVRFTLVAWVLGSYKYFGTLNLVRIRHEKASCDSNHNL